MTLPSLSAPSSGVGGDRLFHLVTAGAAWLVLLLLGGAAASMAWGGRLAFETFGWGFVTSTDWNAVAGSFGALVPIYGTIVTSALALLIAVPVSLGIALFLTDIAPRWARGPIGIAIELLAAIPSIVYGMWGLLVFAPFFSKHAQPALAATAGKLPVVGALFSGPPLGVGLLAAGVILGIMIIPFIAAVMRDVFEVTPALLKESAYGVGATTWEVVWNVVLPYTKVGVAGGIMLGLGRALGETMAVTFVIGNTNLLDNVSLFTPGNSITSALANEFSEADPGLHTAALMELGLVLFAITFLVLAFSKWMLAKLKINEGAPVG